MESTKLITTETNLIDLASIKLSQNFQDQIGVTKKQVSIPITKPHNQWFFRTHTNPEYWFETTLLKLKDENEFYLVDPSVASEIPDQVQAMLIVTSITRHGDLFVWPIRMPDSQGKHSQWHRSALVAANTAQSKWIKLSANMGVGAYDLHEATGNLPEPEWPKLSFGEIVTTAFKNYYITTSDHPVLKRLQGAI